VRRHLLAIVLVLGLIFGSVACSNFVFWGSLPIASGMDFKPAMRVPVGVDVNSNRVSDGLDAEIVQRVANHSDTEPANVIVMLNGAPDQSDTGAFAALGGVVTTELWNDALYGFGGQIPFSRIVGFANSRSDILLVEKEAACKASLAYAATQVGARPYMWSNLGLQGDPNSASAIIDTGIDASHPDFSPGYGNLNFSDKIVGWNNQVTSTATPYDDNGHGSHVSGLAAGDGFFSVDSSGYATATWSANLGAVSSSGTYYISGMMVNRTGPITLNVKWNTTGTAKLSALPLYYGGKSINPGTWSSLASVNTPAQNTPYSLTYNVASTPSGGYDLYHPLLTLTAGTGSLYVVFTMSWPYSPPSDGFSAWTGLAPQSKLVSVKVLDNSGSGTSTGLINGINWVIANKVNYHITVASMSLGFSAEVTAVDTATANLVNAGISTVVAAGNSGTGSNFIFSPGSVDQVITVAAMNQFDDISSFSSQGGTSRYTGNTMKPDITAPGGSFYGAPLFSTDSNYNDAEGGFSDLQPNDAAPMQGTSMATPVVSGAVELVEKAMGGYSAWNWTRSQALMPKMILLMTATETYPNLRETDTSANSPTLTRGGKDVHEGYGRLNVNTAADAVLKTYKVGTTVTDNLGSPPTPGNIAVLGQSLAWARNVQLLAGTTYNFSLAVPTGADYDLYLYNTTGTAYGEPIINAKSTTAALGGFEKISYTPVLSGKYYLVVKLATEDSGGGQFTFTSTPTGTLHLLLGVSPNQAQYSRTQPLTFTVDVLNKLNPALSSTLTLTVTGPGNYYYFVFQTVNVTADTVGEYSFTWNIPNVAGTYAVEVGLVPSQLTAYDSVWVNVS
jgi:subtilisin family serine protease